jgi:hypothetical protein
MGLQASDIEVEGELAVAHGHGAVGVDRGDSNVVAGDERVAVDRCASGGRVLRACGESERKKAGDGGECAAGVHR